MGLEASEQPISERYDLLGQDQRAGYRRVESWPLFERMGEGHIYPFCAQMAKVELDGVLRSRPLRLDKGSEAGEYFLTPWGYVMRRHAKLER
jgi:hypothetical protein